MTGADDGADGAGGHDDPRRHLSADCARCVGLCCVAPAFAASPDFAIDKPAGTPCPNLTGGAEDTACGIHAELPERGFRGCAAFDCFGAGQQVTQVVFGGRDWREGPAVAASMFSAFTGARHLHETLWYLAEAMALVPEGPLHEEIDGARAATERLVGAGAEQLAALDTTAHRHRVGPLLERTSLVVRAEAGALGVDRRGEDLIGARLRGADLRGAGLRGAYLIEADLRGADLRWADLLGADLRGADVRGAQLADALFLTRTQLGSATGDGATTLPAHLPRPQHWSGRRPGTVLLPHPTTRRKGR